MCDHAPSLDPRKAGSCVKCGKPYTDRRDLGRRDPRFEKQFLDEAERLAGLSHTGFTEEVQARLHRAEREKGADSYLELGMRRLVHEIGEEALDVAGWATVASLAAYRHVPSDDDRGELHLVLQQIAAHGPLVWRLCQQAQDLLTG